jgi:diguanylate cyclase (GGDEF)-like protein
MDNKISNYTIATYPFGLFILSLGNFNHLVHDIGHDKGDLILKEVAARLTNSLPNADCIARYDNEVFAIVLTIENTFNNLTLLINQVHDVFHESFEIENMPFTLSACIGIAVYPYDGKNSLILRDNALNALKAAKSKGNNTYTLFETNS